MNVPMKVYGVLADPNTEVQIVILKDDQNSALLPIWIGASEANAIRLAMEKIAIPRPLTHNLLQDLLTSLNIRLEKVVINDVNNSIYYATLYLEQNGSDSTSGIGESETKPPATEKDKEDENKKEGVSSTTLQIDARPSDAIALSLRCGAPLYVAQEVLNKKDTNDGLTEWLTRLRPKNPSSSYNG